MVSLQPTEGGRHFLLTSVSTQPKLGHSRLPLRSTERSWLFQTGSTNYVSPLTNETAYRDSLPTYSFMGKWGLHSVDLPPCVPGQEQRCRGFARSQGMDAPVQIALKIRAVPLVSRTGLYQEEGNLSGMRGHVQPGSHLEAQNSAQQP